MKGKRAPARRARRRTALVLAPALIAGLGAAVPAGADDPSYPFRDPRLTADARVDDLLSRLTLDEKVSLLHQWQPAIPRLGIGAFKTGTEALHGVAWLGEATVFPQAVGLGATITHRSVVRETEGDSGGGQGRCAVTSQARESNHTPSPLSCASSVTRSRSSAASTDAASRSAMRSFAMRSRSTAAHARSASGP